ncbi:unnamed protein product [Lathyrus oleraceus]
MKSNEGKENSLNWGSTLTSLVSSVGKAWFCFTGNELVLSVFCFGNSRAFCGAAMECSWDCLWFQVFGMTYS